MRIRPLTGDPGIATGWVSPGRQSCAKSHIINTTAHPVCDFGVFRQYTFAYIHDPLPAVTSQSASRICIVDDNRTALAQMCLILERAGLTSVEGFESPIAALERFRISPPSVLLLDYQMPSMNGLALLKSMRCMGLGERLPVVIVSGAPDAEALKMLAYREGVLEIVRKPVNPQELALKVRNLSLLVSHPRSGGSGTGLGPLPIKGIPTPAAAPFRGAGAVLSSHPQRTTDASWMRMLERVASIRDENTGSHTQRMAHYAATIAINCGMDLHQQALLLQAAPLHDIGKIGIPDAILLKPGKLSDDEMQTMRRHTTIGYELLRDEPSPALRLGAEIALAHHERWDGTGYPLGLRGTDIPLSARIVAVADAFDAMTTVRPYKPAWLVERAVAVIEADRDQHFDPTVVDAFQSRLDDILKIKRHFDGDDAYLPRPALPH